MREAKVNTLLNQYLRETRMYCYYELKVATTTTFPFSKIEQNQDEGLAALSKSGLVWKISDEDSRQKPCDGFCAPPLPAYLVIKFGEKLCMVLYDEILRMKEEGDTFITEEEAISLSTKVIHIGH